MPHYFRYPSASTSTAYTSTLTLNPAFVTIQEELIRPAQRVIETDDGTQWAFQLSANRLQRYVVDVQALSLSSGEGGQGYTNLKTFFDTASSVGPNYSINKFDLFHTDASTVAITVRLTSPQWTFQERSKDRFTGRFELGKVF